MSDDSRPRTSTADARAELARASENFLPRHARVSARVLQEAVRNVFHTVVMTGAAAAAVGEETRQRLEALSASDRLFVFVIAKDDHDRRVSVSDRVIRVSSVESLPELLRQNGLKPAKVLTLIAGPADPDYSPIVALQQGPSGFMPPFTIAGGEPPIGDAEPEEAIVFPVIKDGKRLEGAAAAKHILETLLLAPRINVTETASVIANGEIRLQFALVRRRAHENLQTALNDLRVRIPRVANLGAKLFDPRSGAIFFEPEEWLHLRADPTPVVTRLREFFDEQLENYWEADRPCKRRILFTPTKVLLRGEQYYTNMRRVSPLVRLRMMWQEMENLQNAASCVHLATLESDAEWKLVLGLLDQVRHVALVTFAAAHAATAVDLLDRYRDDFKKTWGNAEGGVHGLLRYATDAYYSAVCSDPSAVTAAVQGTWKCWTDVKSRLTRARDDAESTVRRLQEAASDGAAPPPLGDIVRRWREADHPGENLLTCLLALASNKDRDVHAVGIGWGGIEIPLVYDFVARRFGAKRPHVHIAIWSHYRNPGREVIWYDFPVHADQRANLAGAHLLLFDDNTLTGMTLERLRDVALLEDAASVQMYITRYSDERRWGHMKMDEHGVVDPERLLNSIGGYIGATPFARSFSSEKKKYRNPIGVFSLSRRRILECIYNNSTVELYDREGF